MLLKVKSRPRLGVIFDTISVTESSLRTMMSVKLWSEGY